MRRRLDVVRMLFREPCPVDPSSLPRVPGGLACAACGRTVVDVSTLTLEEAAAFRRRARSGGERVCGAYSIDRDDRVLLRAAPNSSAVIAVAVSTLLAACDGRGAGAAGAQATAGQTTSPHQRMEAFVPARAAAPASSPAASGDSTNRASVPVASEAATRPDPPCAASSAPGTRPLPHLRASHARKDVRELAGY